MVTQQEHDAAVDQAQAIQASGKYIVAARFESDSQMMIVTFAAGYTISFAKERCQAIANVSDADLSDIDISPAGRTIDFPRIDNGLTAEGILAGRFGNATWEREWAEKHRLVAA